MHTAPTDELGTPVGWVMHAATGYPVLMIMTVPQCAGSSNAYVGPISSWYSVVTENFQRKTDSEWAGDLEGNPALAPWTADFRP